MKKLLIPSLLLAFLALGGCSKKESPAPQKTKAQLLTGAKLWTLSKLELYDLGTAKWVSEPIDGDFYYPSFLAFTSITFASNGTITMKGEGGGPNNSYTDTGTWSLSGSVLTVTPANESLQISTLTTLNERTFVASWDIEKTGFSKIGEHGVAVYATGVRETFMSGD